MSGVNVYVDVDGVLLPFREPVLGMRWGWDDWLDYRPSMGQVYSPRMVQSLNTIAATPGVNMFWLTTGGERAASELAPAIGLEGAEDWPVLGGTHHRNEADGPFDWWKLSTMAEHTAGKTCIWLDDDIHDDDEARDWLHARMHVQWLSPESYIGLRPTHMKMLAAWVLRAIGRPNTLGPIPPTPERAEERA